MVPSYAILRGIEVDGGIGIALTLALFPRPRRFANDPLAN